VALFGIHNLFHPDYVDNVLIGILNREMDHAPIRDRTAAVHLSGSIQKSSRIVAIQTGGQAITRPRTVAVATRAREPARLGSEGEA
jgi:hypothetical protein